MQDLLGADAHFGHQARYWNPKMQKYIYGTYSNIHIINLERTIVGLRRACEKVHDIAKNRNKLLFVGTKKTARDLIKKMAESVEQYYVNHRWTGGMLTNYKTVSASIEKLNTLEKQSEDGSLEQFTKKEAMMHRREMMKLQRNIGGIRSMGGLPDALFVIDIRREHIAVAEAFKLGIPVIAVVDTNSNPDMANYVIPGNDDSVKAIELYLMAITEAFRQGNRLADEIAMAPDAKRKREAKAAVTVADLAEEGPDAAPSDTKQAELEAPRDAPTEARPVRPAASRDTKLRKRVRPNVDEEKDKEAKEASSSAKPAITSKETDAPPTPTAAEETTAPAKQSNSNIDAALVKQLRAATGAGILECKKALMEADGDLAKAIERLRIAGQAKSVKKADRDASQGLLAVCVEANQATIARLNCETDFVARNQEMVALIEDLVKKACVQQAPSPEALFEQDAALSAKFQDIRHKMGENIVAPPFTHLAGEKGGSVAAYLHTNRLIAAVVSIDKDEPQLCYDLAMQVAAMNPQIVYPEDLSQEELDKERVIYTEQIKDEDKPDAIKQKMIAGKMKKYAAGLALSEQASIKDPQQKIAKLLKSAKVEKVRFIRCELGREDTRAPA